MAKVFFTLGGAYEGLRVRRLASFGRIVLDQVINDPPPYWFVTIKNYDPESDRILSGAKFGNGTFRFVSLKDAQAKFDALCQVPEYRSDEEKAQKRRTESAQRLKAAISEGRIEPLKKRHRILTPKAK